MRPFTPKVSIIIPTHNRKSTLKGCLLSLDSLDYPRDQLEVIVVDDGSTDGTAETVETVRSSVSYKLMYVRLEAQGGISVARNKGISEANGDIFVFTDDDCLFDRLWLSQLVSPFALSHVGTVGGPDRVSAGAGFFQKCVDYLFTSLAGTGGLRRGSRLRLGRYYPKGCNMAVRSSVMQETGMFDEQLGPSEEIELGYRIVKKGYAIDYVPQAYVWHNRELNLSGLVRKMFNIGYMRCSLAFEHKGLLQIGHLIPPLSLISLFLLLALALTSNVFLYILLLLLGLYAAVLLISGIQLSIRIGDARALFAVPALLLLHHTAHGSGFLLSAMRHMIGSEKGRHNNMYGVKQ